MVLVREVHDLVRGRHGFSLGKGMVTVYSEEGMV
jgi:hypothetical protein